MFFARSFSLRVRPSKAARASTVMLVSATGCTWKESRVPSSTGLVGVADLGEVAGGELVGVDDDRRAAGDVAEVGLEGRGVHRDEHVGGVTGGQDVVVGEVQLEARDAGEGALGGADLRGEVGQRRQVVAHRGGLAREPVAGELHAVPGVTGETDHHAVERLDGLAAHWSPWSVGGGGSWCRAAGVPRAQRRPSYVAHADCSAVSTHRAAGFDGAGGGGGVPRGVGTGGEGAGGRSAVGSPGGSGWGFGPLGLRSGRLAGGASEGAVGVTPGGRGGLECSRRRASGRVGGAAPPDLPARRVAARA